MKHLTWLKRAVSTVLVLGLLLSSPPATRVQRLGGNPEANIVYAIPFVTATKTDLLLTDPNNDDRADPGETIRYTTTITNSGTSNATGVQFRDTIDANTTLVPGSVKTTPIARNDGVYDVLGNVGITVPVGSGLLVNDDDPDGSGPVSVVGFDATSANGGNVSVAADGSFTYKPAPGFEGSDSFGYLIQDVDGFQDPAFVSLIVSDVIWFINNSVAPGGDGRLGMPFNSLSAYNSTAAGQAEDIIFVYTGNAAYTGGISLLNGQKLIGQGASDTIRTITGIIPPAHSNPLPGTGGGKPTLTNGGGTGVSLASNNLVRGLAVTGTGGAGLAGSGVNNLTIRQVNVSNTTGAGIHLANLSGTATLETLSVIGSSVGNVLIENNTGTATIDLTNATVNTAGNDGLSVKGTGSANVTLNVSGSSFTHNLWTQLEVHAEGNSVVEANITGNSFDGDPAVIGNVGLDLAVRDSATLTFDVLGTGGSPQVFQPFRSQVINVFASGGGTASGRVNGNTVLGSAFGSGVRVVAQVTDVGGLHPDITVEVNGNTISGVSGGLAGIHIEARDGSNGLAGAADVDATVSNNSVTTTGADAAIQVYLSDPNGTANRVCLNATGNATQANGGAFGETDFFFGNDAISGANSGIAQMQGYAGSVSNTWFNVNGNTSTTSPTPLADSLGPIGPGTCSVVVQSAPAQSDVLLAQADTGAPRTFDVLAAASTTLSKVNVGAALRAATQWAANLAPALGAAPAFASGETVSLALGSLNPGQVVRITFDVTIDDPFPVETAKVCNQGLFSGDNLADLLTDDPSVGGVADPTCTAVPPTGTITAHKFDDLNGDGVLDAGEPALGGWTMTLYRGPACDPARELESGVTDGSGSARFGGRPAETYSVRETLRSGWKNTTPLCQDVPLAAGGATIVRFGNMQEPGPEPATIYIPLVFR